MKDKDLIIDKNMERKKKLTQRKLSALETKKTIKNVALRLFTKYGYDVVTIDEITTAAGVSKGSFYNHFDSKESVLVEEFKNIDLSYIHALEKIPPETSAYEKIVLLINVMTTYISTIQNVDFMRVVYSSQISSVKTISILNNPERMLYKYMSAFIREGVAKEEFRLSYSEEDVVEWMIRSARGLIYDWCLYEGKWDIIIEGEKYFKAILDTMKKA